ncbi:MAG: hypothetical protein ABUM51_04470 [Bacteroidota bacterium]
MKNRISFLIICLFAASLPTFAQNKTKVSIEGNAPGFTGSKIYL